MCISPAHLRITDEENRARIGSHNLMCSVLRLSVHSILSCCGILCSASLLYLSQSMVTAYGSALPQVKSVTWADPVDDCGGTGVGGGQNQRGKAAAVEAREEGKFWSAAASGGGGGGGGMGVVDKDEDEARQGFQIGAVHLLKKQVRVRGNLGRCAGARERDEGKEGGVVWRMTYLHRQHRFENAKTCFLSRFRESVFLQMVRSCGWGKGVKSARFETGEGAVRGCIQEFTVVSLSQLSFSFKKKKMKRRLAHSTVVK